MSKPIVVIVCMARSSGGSLNGAHIQGTDVPVEEPSTASNSEADLRPVLFGVTPGSGLRQIGPACPKNTKKRHLTTTPGRRSSDSMSAEVLRRVVRLDVR